MPPEDEVNGTSGGPPSRNHSPHSSNGSNGNVRNGDANGLEIGQYVPLIDRINEKIERKEHFFSLEFFPPKTTNGVYNLFQRIDTFEQFNPLFVDVTWHPGSDPGNLDKMTSSMSVAGGCLNYCRVDTMLHITCTMYTREQTLKHLDQAKRLGIRNILALRGDLPPDTDAEIKARAEMPYATDVVRLIREEYGDYFVICVAGYPTGHPDSPTYEDDLARLKEKVDAGADFVITQLFFEAHRFAYFVQRCREIGITVPILPGVMPIQSYESIKHIAKLSKLQIPQKILDDMEPIKQDDAAIRNYGTQLALRMSAELLETGVAPGIHFYTLNREVATIEILQKLGLAQKKNGKSLPWKRHTAHHKRCKEDVRPIFWSMRPKSYLYRTKDWDDYPNGRWGDSASPAYGPLKDYYLFCLNHMAPSNKLRDMWGHELTSEKDVWNVFYNFITGTPNEKDVTITRLPWNEDGGLSAETNLLKDQLAWCNEHGILTINSQPSVNGAPSTDPVVGWGDEGGYVYQKAYLEFFVEKSVAKAILDVLPEYPSVNYHMLNFDNSIDHSNSDKPVAVTWGVFPGKEVQQPTIVDPCSFVAWKDEAFLDWVNIWGKLYDEGSHSYDVLKRIHDNYVLVNLVDNDFPRDTILWILLRDALLKNA